jgi:3'-phosphoadenosine 5'-phosphosulfate sulfotransferase (PAPS reductase)/FAD synthetase
VARDPYLLDGPAVVSFSGGRTSGYLLWHVLRAFGGRLPADVKVVFANTGKERLETLDFVERCSQRWGVEVVWLEFRRAAPHKFAVVDYATAARNGEPFAELIAMRKALPNVVMRYCTGWLKCKPLNRYARRVLGWKRYTDAVGFRADERRRVAKLRPDPKTMPGEEPCAPMAAAGVTLADVMRFWSAQPFDLCLEQGEGNCDLCFLKATDKTLDLIRRRPGSADWWIEQEAAAESVVTSARAARFRKDRPKYADLRRIALDQEVFGFLDDDLGSCRCTD